MEYSGLQPGIESKLYRGVTDNRDRGVTHSMRHRNSLSEEKEVWSTAAYSLALKVSYIEGSLIVKIGGVTHNKRHRRTT